MFFINIKSSTIKTLVFLAEMILGRLDILLKRTKTYGCVKLFSLLYSLQNSSVFQPITNLTKQIGILMKISLGKCDI